MKKLLLFLLNIIFIISCGVPPPSEAVEDYLFDYISPIIGQEHEINKDLRPDDFFPEKEKFIYLTKGNNFKYTQKALPEDKIVIDRSIIFKTVEEGFFELLCDIYITADKKFNLFYSFDNLDWYAFESELNHEVLGSFILKNYDKTLEVETNWGVYRGERPKKRRRSFQKNIVSTYGGELVASTESVESGLNLKDNILFLQKGKKFRFGMDINSNLVKAENLEEGMLIELLSDLYLYKKGFHISVSFDGSDWSTSIFSFDFNLRNSVSASLNNNYYLLKLEGALHFKGFL